MASNLSKYTTYLVDRLYDLRTALEHIEHGDKEPRITARAALVNDEKARTASVKEFSAQLAESLGDSR